MCFSTHVSFDNFPTWQEAPEDLKALAGNCGPLSLWMVTKALGHEFSTATIIKACRFISGEGMYGIRLALAFKELGFIVEYRSHSVHLPEDTLGKEAKEAGLTMLPPRSLQELLSAPGITVMSYEVITSGGHFTPVLKMDDRSAYLPLDYETPVQAMEIVERQRSQSHFKTISIIGMVVPPQRNETIVRRCCVSNAF
jgi:hypothetical protein